MPFDFSQMNELKAGPSLEELRQDLIVAVEHGEISPEAAELKVREMGLDGFSRYPNPSAFSAMAQDVWSLDMALAWIIWRTPEKVEEYWVDSRAKSMGWQPIRQLPQTRGFGTPPAQAVSGHQLVTSHQLSIFSESSPRRIFVFGEKPTPDAEERLERVSAEKALRSALIYSQLIASARKCSTEEIVDIPSREWSRFHYHASTETQLFIPPARRYEPEEVEILYREVTVLRNDVVRLWPESGPDYRTGELVENTREDRYLEWLSHQSNAYQVIGRFLLEEWNLDIRPITDGSRLNKVEAFAKALGASPPSEKTISRFIKSAKAWLGENRQ